MHLPSRRIARVQSLACPVIDYDWPFAQREAQRIQAHWNGLVARKPMLFNGRVFLLRDFDLREDSAGGVFEGRHFETDFRNFVSWRDFGFPADDAKNCFAMAAVRSADGAFMLGRMGAHTANAGKIYFPAATPDRGDLAGAVLDFELSARRELLEETGLDAQAFQAGEGWTIVAHGARIACMKEFHAPFSAAELQQEVQKNLARQSDRELDGVVFVSSEADIAVGEASAAMPDFMAAYLRHALGGQPAG
ncbi:MAG: NUDIX hydrolase [Alphaproteobacteria bacterium]|nr:NUDIX hydrolase [Alphaproteobacteria bacterium]